MSYGKLSNRTILNNSNMYLEYCHFWDEMVWKMKLMEVGKDDDQNGLSPNLFNSKNEKGSEMYSKLFQESYQFS